MRFYQSLLDKIFLLEKHIKERKEKEESNPVILSYIPNYKAPHFFSFLDFYEHLKLSYYKFLLVMTEIGMVVKGEPVSNFNVFTRAGRDGVYICNYSYCHYKSFHKNTKWRSLSIIIIATVIVSLAVALVFPGKPVSKAATINWLQSSWSGGASGTNAKDPDDRTTWNKYASSPAPDVNISAGATVTLSEIAGTANTETSDADFNASSATDTTDGNFNAGSYGSPAVTQSDGAGGVKLVLPPGAPTWQGTPLAVGNSQLTVQWVAPANNGGSALTGYRVYRSPDNITFTEISSGACSNASLNGSSTSCIDTSLTNGSTYYYKILATNAIGNGTLSSVSSQILDFVYSSGNCPGITVYYQSIGVQKWKANASDCVPPQCSLTGTYPDDLVASNLVDFTTFPAYPARDDCKTVGGRLPTISELECIYTYRASLGNNFGSDFYWSSTENDATNAAAKLFTNGNTSQDNKASVSSHSVRCVR